MGCIWAMWAKGIAMSRVISATFALVLLPLGTAWAHGAQVSTETVSAIRITALYDTGAPMADADVLIFAPDAPQDVWDHGRTDAAGAFLFTPDDRAGRWTIQVRSAGHGAMAHVERGTETALTLRAPERPDWTQRALMVALVGWGALGTALFAMRRKGDRNASA